MGQEAFDTGSYEDYISLGLLADHNTEAYRYAAEIRDKLNAGRAVTNIEMGQLTAAVYADALGVGEKRSEEAREEPDDRPLRAYVKRTLDDFQTDLERAFMEEEGKTKETASGTEAAEPIQVGRVTTIRHPYQGEVPVQQQSIGAVISVPNTYFSLAEERIGFAQYISAQGGQGFKTVLTRLYQNAFKKSKSIYVEGLSFGSKPYLVEIGNRVPGKVISDPNLSPEKLSLLEMLPLVVHNAHYVGSGEYMSSGKKQHPVTRYDYFETPVIIAGKTYIAKFDVEVLPDVNNYRTHQIVKVDLATPGGSLVGPVPTAVPRRTGP